MINAAVNALLGSVIGIIALLLTAALLTTLNMGVWADRLLPRSIEPRNLFHTAPLAVSEQCGNMPCNKTLA